MVAKVVAKAASTVTEIVAEAASTTDEVLPRLRLRRLRVWPRPGPWWPSA